MASFIFEKNHPPKQFVIMSVRKIFKVVFLISKIQFLIFKNFYCYSITVVCIFSPSLDPTPKIQFFKKTHMVNGLVLSVLYCAGTQSSFHFIIGGANAKGKLPNSCSRKDSPAFPKLTCHRVVLATNKQTEGALINDDDDDGGGGDHG